jgi:hypothetical protein
LKESEERIFPIYLQNIPIYSPIILKSHLGEANTANNFIKNNDNLAQGKGGRKVYL